MKSLKINSDCCLLTVNGYGDVDISNQHIQELICEKLPQELENYKDYSVKLNVSIEFLDTGLDVQTDGYTIEKDKQNEDASTEGDADV